MKKYLIKDIRLGVSEQDNKEYALNELKEYFKLDIDNNEPEEDIEFCINYNNKLDECIDIYDLESIVNEYDTWFSFKECE